MSGIIKPGEHPLEERVKMLEGWVANTAVFLKLIEGWMLVNKAYFDKLDIKTDEKKEEKKK